MVMDRQIDRMMRAMEERIPLGEAVAERAEAAREKIPEPKHSKLFGCVPHDPLLCISSSSLFIQGEID